MDSAPAPSGASRNDDAGRAVWTAAQILAGQQ
jgi:hypothetical protein